MNGDKVIGIGLFIVSLLLYVVFFDVVVKCSCFVKVEDVDMMGWVF